ncbi:MAG: hypothetical protein ABIH50_02150 [bacterium]
MKLGDKIKALKVSYLLTKETSTAFELALLYYILATRKTAGDKIAEASYKSIFWLKKAGIKVPGHIRELIEIERLLVKNRYIVGARFYPQFVFAGNLA